MRDPAEELRAVRDALAHPWRERATLGRFFAGALPRLCACPAPAGAIAGADAACPCPGPAGPSFRPYGSGHLLRHREAILDRQLVQEPIAEAAMELYASACVLSRRDAELSSGGTGDSLAAWEPAAAALFLRQSARRIRAGVEPAGQPRQRRDPRLAKRVLESG